MNTLIDTKIKTIFEDSKGHWVDYEWIDEDGSKHIAKAIPVTFYKNWLEILATNIEKQTREESDKEIANGIGIICERYPSLATEIKAILYDELKEKK